MYVDKVGLTPDRLKYSDDLWFLSQLFWWALNAFEAIVPLISITGSIATFPVPIRDPRFFTNRARQSALNPKRPRSVAREDHG
jgi:hypothetical protein